MIRINKLIVLSLLLLLLSACQENKEIIETEKSAKLVTEQKEDENTNYDSSSKASESDIKVNDNGNSNQEYSLIDETFLPNLAKGKIKYCEIPLDRSITAKEITTKLGDPEWQGGWEGGFGRKYGDCVYYVQDFYETKNDNATMTAIDYGNENLKKSVDEIKNILGQPTSEGISEVDGSYLLVYESGIYTVFFTFNDKNSPVSYLTVK